MKGWRTLLFSALIALIGVVEAFDWVEVIPEQYHGWAITLIGVIVAYLRKITTGAIGSKD